MPKKRKSKALKKELMNFDLNSGEMIKSSTNYEVSESIAIIYCRVSDISQVNYGSGLEGQERLCKERCEKQNPPIQVDKVFIEPGVSGANSNRKEFNNALKYLSKENKKYSRITHFVVSTASRISRPENIAEAFTLESKIKSYGVQIVKVDSPGIDDTTDLGVLFKTITYAMSGYERKQIVKNALNGRVTRMKNGHRPFVKPPVGYSRRKVSKKNYIDEIDPEKGPIIKEGLELFATDALISQSDLRRFRDSKGLRTSDPNAKKLWHTFPEKTLQLHRLFYYAGCIFYPDRGIDKPIEAQHVGLISIGTVKAIIGKLQKIQKGGKKIRSKIGNEEYPLRGVITCTGCNRKFTSWVTTKYPVKTDRSIVKKYQYYGCQCRGCSERMNLPKKKLEEQFVKLLSSMKLSEGVLKLLELTFDFVQKENEANSGLRRKGLEKQLLTIRRKQEQIEKTMLRTNNNNLYEKLEKEWAVLDSEYDILEERYNHKSIDSHRTKVLFDKTKAIFTNPVDIREIGNHTMRQLLIKVRFKGDLIYSKKEGLQTRKEATLYRLMNHFGSSGPGFDNHGQNFKLTMLPFLNDYMERIKESAEYIDLLRVQLKYQNLGKELSDGSFQLTLPVKG